MQTTVDHRTAQAFQLVAAELERATKLHGAFHSAHEGFGVIKEEFDEFWDEIKLNDAPATRKECVQLAAMAIRFLIDVKGPES